jgi:hypothetical protein
MVVVNSAQSAEDVTSFARLRRQVETMMLREPHMDSMVCVPAPTLVTSVQGEHRRKKVRIEFKSTEELEDLNVTWKYGRHYLISKRKAQRPRLSERTRLPGRA